VVLPILLRSPSPPPSWIVRICIRPPRMAVRNLVPLCYRGVASCSPLPARIFPLPLFWLVRPSFLLIFYLISIETSFSTCRRSLTRRPPGLVFPGAFPPVRPFPPFFREPHTVAALDSNRRRPGCLFFRVSDEASHPPPYVFSERMDVLAGHSPSLLGSSPLRGCLFFRRLLF